MLTLTPHTGHRMQYFPQNLSLHTIKNTFYIVLPSHGKHCITSLSCVQGENCKPRSSLPYYDVSIPQEESGIL